MRLFFALGFSPATRQAIAQVQQRLRRAAPTARCPAEGNLHLTLAFLGEVPPARLEDATAALEAISPRRLALRLSQIGQFPQEEMCIRDRLWGGHHGAGDKRHALHLHL